MILERMSHRLAGALAGAALLMAVTGCAEVSPSATSNIGPSESSSASSTPEEHAAAWTATGAMIEARALHTATLLSNGTVLVAGGDSSSGVVLASAELYDPSTGSWTATGNMVGVRRGHTATLLPDGMVLVAGGGSSGNASYTVATAELYDPSSGSWAATGTMIEARALHTATLLRDGKLLAAGGITSSYFPSPVPSAELYDPGAGSWTAAGEMDGARAGHTAALLADGTVLVAGSVGLSGTADALASAELYDPSTRSWAITAAMIEASWFHTATLLSDGKVLVAGGAKGPGDTADALASSQLYDSRGGY